MALVGCAPKAEAPETDAPAATATAAAKPGEDEGELLSREEIQRAAIAVRVNNLLRLATSVDVMLATWFGTPPAIASGLEAILQTPTANNPAKIDLNGTLFADVMYPHPGQTSTPEDLIFRAFIPAASPERISEASGRLQPLGQNLWEFVADEGPQIYVREETDGVSIATSQPLLDQMMQTRRAESTKDPQFQLQVEVANLPGDTVDPSRALALDKLGVPSLTRALSTVIQRLVSLRLQAGINEGSDLSIVARASAPFDELGLRSLGDAKPGPSVLASVMPPEAIFTALLTIDDPTPVVREFNALVRGVEGQVLPPFDEAVEGITEGARGVLAQLDGEVLVTAYLTKKGELALVLAAQTPDVNRTRDALRQVMLVAERVLKSHIALIGEDPQERYEASFKPEGLGFAQGRADIFAIELSRALSEDVEKAFTPFFGAKRRDVEVLALVDDGVSIVTLGVGGRAIMSDVLRRRARARTPNLETAGGLTSVRDLLGGCQLCATINPHRTLKLVSVMAKAEGEDIGTQELATRRELDVNVAIGAGLDEGNATFATSIPGVLVNPPEDIAALVRSLSSSPSAPPLDRDGTSK